LAKKKPWWDKTLREILEDRKAKRRREEAAGVRRVGVVVSALDGYEDPTRKKPARFAGGRPRKITCPECRLERTYRVRPDDAYVVCDGDVYTDRVRTKCKARIPRHLW
jgi:hypothetical protein